MMLESGKRLAVHFHEAKLSHKIITGVSALVSLMLILFLSFYVFTYFNGPLIDEWHCSEGERPADNVSGGSACFPTEEDLPPDYTWHPLGNRPFDCNNRHGWEPVIHEASGETDCIKKTTPMRIPPLGYRYRDYIIMS